MTREQIIAELRVLVADQLGREIQLEGASDFQSDLGLDSLKRLALVVAIENRFKVCFEPEDDEGIRTVDDLVNAIRRYGGRID
ncbi:MAG: acyl carrier protein [Myxococcota bacterium]